MANKVTLTFAGDAKQLAKTMGQVDKDTKKLSANLSKTSKGIVGGIGKVAKGAAIGLGAGVVALGAFGMSAIEAGEALNSIRSQTAAVVESTKGIANVSTKHVKEYSQELSDLAAVDRKVIEASQNVLLTFTNVRNEVGKGNDIFDQGSLAALNMSAALGQDLQSATTMVGKALNDPIQGINAMSRAGIQFTQQQKDQIKTMVEAGDVLGAQKIILGELETQFAGSAAANADASDKIKLAFSRITEEVGLKLLPYLDIFADWVLGTGIPAMSAFAGWIGDEIVPRLQDMGAWLGDNVVPTLQDMGAWLTGTGIPALQQFAGWLGENTDVLKAVAVGVAAVLVPAFVAWAISAAAAAAATLLAMAPLILIGVAVAALAYLIIHNWDWIKNATQVAFDAVVGFIKSAFNWVVDNWPLLLAIITGPIGIAVLVLSGHWDTIKDGFTKVKNWIIDGMTAVKDWVMGRIDDIVGFFKGLPARAAEALKSLASKIAAPFKDAYDKVKGYLDKIPGLGGGMPSISLPGFSMLGLASGGIVPATPGGRVVRVAEGGRDEVVAPLSDLAGIMSRSGGGGGGTTALVLQSSGRRVDNMLIEILREAIDERGGNVLKTLGHRG